MQSLRYTVTFASSAGRLSRLPCAKSRFVARQCVPVAVVYARVTTALAALEWIGRPGSLGLRILSAVPRRFHKLPKLGRHRFLGEATPELVEQRLGLRASPFAPQALDALEPNPRVFACELAHVPFQLMHIDLR